MVDRYGQDWNYEPSRVMKREDGIYVKYYDYEALEAKLAALVELIESMRGQWIHSVHAEDCIKAISAASKERP